MRTVMIVGLRSRKKRTLSPLSFLGSTFVIHLQVYSPDFMDMENAAAFPTRRVEMVADSFIVIDWYTFGIL
jgi:hypothetical protein